MGKLLRRRWRYNLFMLKRKLARSRFSVFNEGTPLWIYLTRHEELQTAKMWTFVVVFIWETNFLSQYFSQVVKLFLVLVTINSSVSLLPVSSCGQIVLNSFMNVLVTYNPYSYKTQFIWRILCRIHRITITSSYILSSEESVSSVLFRRIMWWQFRSVE